MIEETKKRIATINSSIVPKGWKSVRLDDIAEVFDGIHQTPDYKLHGIKFVSVENINDLYSSDKYISEEDYIKDYKIKPEINDILMTRIGDIGTPAIVDSDEPLAFYVSLALIKCNSKINSKYIYCFISSQLFQKELWKKTLHIAFPKKINKGDIGKCKLLLPSIGEQQKIAEILTTQDKLIELQERSIEQLKTLKKGYLQKMFPKKGCKYPELRFKGFTEPWEKRKLGDVVTVGNGMDYKDLGEGDIPVYGTGGYMLSVDKALSYDKDAVGIGRKGTIDNPYILKAPFWTVDTLFYCIPKENYDLDFVYGIFQNINWKKKDESTGVPSLSKVNINSTDIAIPSLAEQQKMGTFFARLDRLITLHQRKLDKEKQKKKALMQLLLTGKVRVST